MNKLTYTFGHNPHSGWDESEAALEQTRERLSRKYPTEVSIKYLEGESAVSIRTDSSRVFEYLDDVTEGMMDFWFLKSIRTDYNDAA